MSTPMQYQYLFSYSFQAVHPGPCDVWVHGRGGIGSIILSMAGPLTAGDLARVYAIVREQGQLSEETVIVPIAFSRFDVVTPMPVPEPAAPTGRGPTA